MKTNKDRYGYKTRSYINVPTDCWNNLGIFTVRKFGSNWVSESLQNKHIKIWLSVVISVLEKIVTYILWSERMSVRASSYCFMEFVIHFFLKKNKKLDSLVNVYNWKFWYLLLCTNECFAQHYMLFPLLPER